jgi:hypothetical protein
MNDTDARLWHPWLRINRVGRTLERGGGATGESRVREGARAEKSHPPRGLVELGS